MRSVRDLNFAHVIKLMIYSAKLPEVINSKFWGKAKSGIFTKIIEKVCK